MTRTPRINAIAFTVFIASVSLLAAADTARAQTAPDVVVGPVRGHQVEPAPEAEPAPPAPSVGPVRGYQVQPAPGTRPLREGVTGLGATQDVLREPRFIVEAVSFRAIDESGLDVPFPSLSLTKTRIMAPSLAGA